MIFKESVFITKRGQNLATYYKVATGESSDAILLFHGYAEHVGRYRTFIDRLSREGFHVFAIDHHGHGNSEGKFGLLKSFDTLVDDVSDWFDSLKKQHPDFKWHVFGHSMGGGIALNFALNRQDELQTMMLSGPLIMLPDGTPGIVKAVGRVVAAIFPSVPIIPIDFDALSRDPDVVRRYKDDPRVYSGKVRARTAIEIDKFASRIRKRLSEITLPFWVGHGDLDRITSPYGSKLLYENASSADKTLKLYNGLFHEILNEPESAIVTHDLTLWLKKRVGK
jgi:acylglycerol lipase